MNEYFKQGYDDGVNFACAMLNTSSNEAVRSKHYNDTIFEDPTMQHNLCKVACSVLNYTDDSYNVPLHLYNNLLLNLEKGYILTKEASENLLGPVVEALGSYAFRNDSKIMEKKAVVSETMSLIEAIAKSGLAIGGIAGGSIGSLAWLLNRNSNMVDEEIDAKREQAKHYREIARDIQERLKAKQEDLKEVADKMGEGAYLV